MVKRAQVPARPRVTASTGNVFRDLGFSAEESAHLLVRSDLMIQLQKLIGSRRLTQLEVAKILRVTQPRVSDLLRGRIDLFSTDTLVDMLARLGVRVRFVLKPSRGGREVA
ncbi:MAG: XRE family transcriptional regulator [Acidobacteria bacterium]|nr:XRE family transcriptional regulator [Acidobacteriota bacterium]